jgi:hypothetical protein
LILTVSSLLDPAFLQILHAKSLVPFVKTILNKWSWHFRNFHIPVWIIFLNGFLIESSIKEIGCPSESRLNRKILFFLHRYLNFCNSKLRLF